ncbi:AAA family ATPase [Gemmata sp. JC717]|uniref:AAA family ATPase n=1 Tax=Gemmata algarum TaxID=2975278 RepID=UPI0021BB7F21|nr:AAA family ATPase [Gemmata algarum]MDY3557037.1 AAA family ATPase [Gemmata algarum]
MPPNPEPAAPPKWAFRGDNLKHDLAGLPPPPPWRQTAPDAQRELASKFYVPEGSKIVEMVNAALLLRRPLLVTGKPGTGKSTLAAAVAEELGLGDPLVWSITTKTTLESGLYQYDAIARLNAATLLRQRRELERARAGEGGPGAAAQHEQEEADVLDVGRYLRLGPLGTAMLPAGEELPPGGRVAGGPRVLLIDEIDKSDIDLPNDLLHVFERCRFEIPELARLPDKHKAARVWTADRGRKARVERGEVVCDQIPLVIMTSNGERDFPPAFLRRCLRLDLKQPTEAELLAIVRARFDPATADSQEVRALVAHYYGLREGSPAAPRQRELAVDQLLNAVRLLQLGVDLEPIENELFRSLTEQAQ